MSSASLCVGVVDYEHPAYGSSSRRLKFAATDAQAFSNYLRTAFATPDAARHHRLLLDHDAIFVKVEQAIAELTEIPDELELFVLYLAGHGERGDMQGGWFCLADATPGTRSLDGARLENLLSAVRARSVLVVVDCCHAEAVVTGMRYFTSLGDRRARLFVASARTDQLAWEDDHLRRSVLSDVFLRGCSTSSQIQDGFGKVKVETALFPYLREQVPLLAAAQKRGSVQEPVTGGTARADVDLPVVDSKSFGRALTIAQTVRARLRQVLVMSAFVLVLLLVGLELLTYHVAPDSTGRILIRSGIPLSHAMMPIALIREIDTGMRVEDLTTRDPQAASEIAQSKLWGMGSHLDVHGVRPWFEQIASLLKKPAAVRIEMLTIEAETSMLPEDSPPPIEHVLFLSRLRHKHPKVIASRLYLPSGADSAECIPGNTRKIDFTIISVPPEPYRRDLLWQSLLTTGDAAQISAAVLLQVQNTSYRAREQKEVDESIADLWQLAFSLGSLKPSSPGSEDISKALVTLLATPCRPHAAIALRLFGSKADKSQAEALLVKDIQTFNRDDQGDLPTATQSMAAAALGVMASDQPVEVATVAALADTMIREDPDLERPTLARGVLLAVAPGQQLPKYLVGRLFARLETPDRVEQSGQLAALELLSRNIAHLEPDLVRRLGAWLDSNALRNHTMSDVHEAVGFLLSSDPMPRPTLVRLLADQLSPETYFPAPAQGYRGELVINVSGDAAAVALGRVMQSRSLPADITERLVRFAIGRRDAPDRTAIIDGLAKHWYGNAISSAEIHSRLASASGDAARRLLEVEVACTRLGRMVLGDRNAVIAELLSAWHLETEPELRAALARVVARSQWPRYADMTMCGSG